MVLNPSVLALSLNAASWKLGAEGGRNCIFFNNKKEIFFYVKILTEGIF